MMIMRISEYWFFGGLFIMSLAVVELGMALIGICRYFKEEQQNKWIDAGAKVGFHEAVKEMIELDNGERESVFWSRVDIEDIRERAREEIK